MPGSGHLHSFTMANKWIGAFLGFITTGSILGSLAGFAVGALFDAFSGGRDEPAATESRATSGEGRREGQRNSFLFSLMVLSAHIIQADGKIMHSEMEYVRDFLRRNFGETARRRARPSCCACLNTANSTARRPGTYKSNRPAAKWRRVCRRSTAYNFWRTSAR